jgi:hypothetical protein
VPDVATTSAGRASLLLKFVAACFLAVLAGATFAALSRDDERVSAADAEAAARYWLGGGTVQPARQEGGGWEVDVFLPDGSLVELRFDRRLKLRSIDEEIGPGGTRAHDEVTGPPRHRAILAAIELTGPGRVISVEHDSPNELDVDIRRPDGTQDRVVLDAKLRLERIVPEDPGDE